MKISTTKNALLMSILSLFLCFAMLTGTTFAWFTDTVESGTNQIVAGNLDVELYNGLDNTAGKVSTSTPLFELPAPNLWEPGAAVYENFTVANEGNLALKYKLSVNIDNAAGGKTLADVLKVGVVEGGIADGTSREDAIKAVNEWLPFASFNKNGNLLATETDTYGVVVWWEPSNNDNDYNMNNNNKGTELSIEIGVNLFATQLDSESDSFDKNYDEFTGLNGEGFGANPNKTGATAVEVQVIGANDPYKDASLNFPAASIAADAEKVSVEINEVDYDYNFTVAAGLETLTYDVQVEGLVDNNTTDIRVMLKLPTNLDPATVAVYHYDTLINGSTYNPNTGYVTFYTKSFSPFTLVYDAESKYVAPDVTGKEFPKAEVTEFTATEGIVWGNYGQWSPTAGLEANLEAAYTFKCTETLEQAMNNPYANWYCDFYVKLDEDLGANQIFLGGNYGSFGWVGFHNGELTLKANTELGLLESVTTNPWTYLDVVQNVGEFICGVGDVDNALSGATFTVMLRLTNPENEAEFVNVATINYTFK